MSGQQLQKNLTVLKGIALAVSMVVGSGLLGLPGLALEAGGAQATAAAWVITTLASLPLIYILTRLGVRFSSSAGLARYAQAGVGEWAGHGVTAVLAGTFSLGIPALALVGGAYAQKLFGFGAHWQFGLGGAILVLATIVNSCGVRLAGGINTVSLIALLAMVTYLVASHAADGGTGAVAAANAVTGLAGLDYTNVWSVCAILFWAYLGWENLSFGLEEFRNPGRSIPLVYWGSFGLVVAVYLALAAVTLGATANGVDVSGAAGLVGLLDGTGIGIAVTAVMVMVILANANAWVFGASRLVYSAGREGILPGFLGRLSHNQVPTTSLWVLLGAYLLTVGVVGSGLMSLSTLIGLVSQNFLFLYAFSIVAFIRTEAGLLRWPMAVAASASCGFFLSGFTWWMAYPLALLAIGFLAYQRQKAVNVPQNAIAVTGQPCE